MNIRGNKCQISIQQHIYPELAGTRETVPWGGFGITAQLCEKFNSLPANLYAYRDCSLLRMHRPPSPGALK